MKFFAVVLGVGIGVVVGEALTPQVQKCCPDNEFLLEADLGRKDCQKRTGLVPPWKPTFTADSIDQPITYVLQTGVPVCDDADEVLVAVFEHEQHSIDELQLLPNGSVTHRLVDEEGGFSTDHRIYEPGKYCLDDLIVLHNYSVLSGTSEHVPFGYICVNNKVDVQTIVDEYVYPIGLAISMFCLVLTFLLYSFLPQLRDLTGKFILGICSFLGMAFALFIVDMFGWRDSNVEKSVTELLLHTSIVGVWLCLNSMGHHVWSIIRSKSVFTRVTDGQKLCYYSAYVWSGVLVIVAVAIAVHFLVEKEPATGIASQLGWGCLSAFYVPASILFLVNLFFYWTTQRRISRQLIYNRSMQHFQVNFDLYIKFLIVLSCWWLFHMLSLLALAPLVYIARVFNIIVGPLIFCVAMCRTRVAFLFKRYFCADNCCFKCCRTNEFIEEDCHELSTIDALKRREDKLDNELPTSSLLPMPELNGSSKDREMSKSLFNVRREANGEIPPPGDPEMPVGRVKRLLKSNSLTAIANVNWGWRKETAV